MKKTYTSAFKARLVLELLKEEKSLSQLASEHKVHTNLLGNWRDLALADFASLFDKKNLTADLLAAHSQQVEELFAHIPRLTHEVNWLKKNLASTLTRAQRTAFVERAESELTLVEQAQLLGLSRASLYYKKVEPSEEEVRLKHRIDELYTQYPFFGSRRMSAQMQREGESANRKRVQPYMREMGIDITYMRLVGGWLYLVAILDWHSRYVVSWELSDTMEMAFVLSAVRDAFRWSEPEIFNSGQGSHFTSPVYIEMLKEAGTRGCNLKWDSISGLRLTSFICLCLAALERSP